MTSHRSNRAQGVLVPNLISDRHSLLEMISEIRTTGARGAMKISSVERAYNDEDSAAVVEERTCYLLAICSVMRRF